MNLVLGAAIDFTGIELPFSVGDLVSSGNELLGFVGAFILLGLAFTFVPKLITLIVSAFGGGYSGERDEHGNRIHFQSAEARAFKEKFYKEKGWKL
jgi:hypothetical protein